MLKETERISATHKEALDSLKFARENGLSTATELIFGLPGETFDSHINSYNKDLSMGLTHIYGGEIQMLPGAQIEEEAHRKKYGLKRYTNRY